MLPKLDSILISMNTILGDKSIPATLHSIEKTTVDANKDMAGYISAIGKNKGELISLLNIQLAITDKDTSKED